MTTSDIIASTRTTSTPKPTPTEPDPSSVTPGVLGFLVVFLLALVTWLLLRNMTGRLRRLRFREEQRQSQLPRAVPPAEPTEPTQPPPGPQRPDDGAPRG